MSGLSMFTVYRNPKDFPGKFVVREHIVEAGKIRHAESPLAVVDSLLEARRAIPFGLVCMQRDPADEPQIVEVWF